MDFVIGSQIDLRYFQNSGTATAPIVWRAYGGEDVVLSAGLTVPPAAFRPRPGHSGQLQASGTRFVSTGPRLVGS